MPPPPRLPLRRAFTPSIFNLSRSQLPLQYPLRRFATTPPPPQSPPSSPTFLSSTPDNSFQKTVKSQLKARSNSAASIRQGDADLWDGTPGHPGKWEVVCGLEVHAQLNTERKLFSDAKTSVNETPNTYVAVFDAALPGSQPIFQPTTLLPALRAAIALNCEIMPESRFDRKHYFYWDQPGGYQITQFYHPLAKDGYIKLFPSDGVPLGKGVEELIIGIKQVQMEQDTAKTITTPSLDPSTPSTHLIDLNRVSHPLIEVITTPCLPSATHASLALKKLQSLLRASGAAIIGMEWGGLRCDVNVSVRPRGTSTLGQRCEIKNLSSIKLVEEAVFAEAKRQVKVLESGGEVLGETRGWDAELKETYRLRGKEGEVDYRYMPEPDVPSVRVSRGLVEWVREGLPELPDAMLRRLVRSVNDDGGEFGLTVKDANTLMAWDGGARVGYYEEVVGKTRKQLRDMWERDGLEVDEGVIKDVGRVVGNWVIHELPSNLTTPTTSHDWSQNPVTTQHLADIITYLLLGKITGPTSKSLIPLIISSSSPSAPNSQAQLQLDIPTYIHSHNLLLIPLSSSELRGIITKIVKKENDMREQYLTILEQLETEKHKDAAGKKIKALEKKLAGLRNWFVGRVVRDAGGRVDAKRVEGEVGWILEGWVGSEGEK